MTIRFELGCKRDAFAVRTAVFMDEQGFFPDAENPGRYIFGRLAVLPEHRKRGYGGLLLEESEARAHIAGAREMHLHAQCYITPFYESYGYESYGDVELDEHVEHIWMKKAL